MDLLRNIDLGEVTAAAEAFQVTHEMFIMVAVGMIVIGILIGILGLKLVRLLAAMTGLCLGAVVGVVVGSLLGLSETMILGLTIAGALILAVVLGIFKKAGMIIWIMLSVISVFGTLFAGSIIGMIVGTVLALVIVGFSVKFFEPLVIIATSVVGGRSIAVGLLALAGKSDSLILNLIAFVVIVILCAAVQFGMHSRKIKKKEESQAKELRNHASREKEIEMARMFFDDEE